VGRTDPPTGGERDGLLDSEDTVLVLARYLAPDGDVFEMEVLRSRQWAESLELTIGDSATLTVFGIPSDGAAEIVGILPAPRLQHGDGAVVLGRFTHIAPRMLEISLGEGTLDVLRVTPSHLVMSATSGDWVLAESVSLGDELQTRDGSVVVRQIRRVERSHRVYDLEISGQHAYFATDAEVLLHNCPVELGASKPPPAPRGGAGPVKVGQQGEAAAGIAPGPKTRIPSATKTAKFRIPDELTDTTLREVKNVAKLDRLSQLKDYAAFAKETGREFVLDVRKNTVFTPRVEKFIKDNNVTVRRILD